MGIILLWLLRIYVGFALGFFLWCLVWVPTEHENLRRLRSTRASKPRFRHIGEEKSGATVEPGSDDPWVQYAKKTVRRLKSSTNCFF